MMDLFNSPISVKDAAAMLMRPEQKNERPYTSTAIRLNNELVNRWKTEVLEKIATDGNVPAGKVWKSWQLFHEGLGVQKFIEVRDQNLLPTPPEETIEHWKSFFENATIEELHELGPGTVSAAWKIVQDSITRWYAEQKWDNLFSTPDPLHWEKEHHKHVNIIEGKTLPFWDEEKLKDVQQKVGAILMNQVHPQGVQGLE